MALYHDVLEAAAVTSDDPPESLIEFNEGDFDAAADALHDQFIFSLKKVKLRTKA